MMSLTLAVIQLILIKYALGDLASCSISKDGTFLDCSSQLLKKIPTPLPAGLVKISFRNNLIQAIQSSDFSNQTSLQHLDLSGNAIQNFDVNSFKDLSALEYLNIGGNKLCFQRSYPDKLFEQQQNLKTLKTLDNQCETNSDNQWHPHKVFKPLANLENLSLDVVENFEFGEGFESLRNLKHLEIISLNSKYGVDVSFCGGTVAKIQDNTFYNLRESSLEHLYLRGCGFNSLHKMALQYFRKLKTFNVACTTLPFIQVIDAINEMETASIQTLILDNVVIGTNLKKLCMPNLDNLRQLSIRNTRIRNFNIIDRESSCLQQLEHVNMGLNVDLSVLNYELNIWPRQNVLKQGFYMNQFHTSMYLPNLRIVDVSYLRSRAKSPPYCTKHETDIHDYFQHVPERVLDRTKANNHIIENNRVKPNHKPGGTDMDSIDSASVVTFKVHPSLQVIIANHVLGAYSLNSLPDTSFLCPFLLFAPDSFTFLNISHNDLNQINCRVFGLSSLSILDASYCKLSTNALLVLKEARNLTELYVSNNKLGSITTKFFDVYHNLPNLRLLDISSNQISFLPRSAFNKLFSLEKIILSRNSLTSFDVDIRKLTMLNWIDLSFNSLSFINVKMTNELDQTLNNITLVLKENPLQCDCESVSFIRWLQSDIHTIIPDKDQLECTSTNNDISYVMHTDVSNLEYDCDNYPVVLIGSLSTLLVLTSLIGLLAYKYRWSIAWHIYRLRRRTHIPLQEEEFIQQGNLYTFFVAYETEDDIGRPWVVNKLCAHETAWDTKFYIFDRDSVVGNSKLAEIVHGIQYSRFCIFVVTHEFLRKYTWQMVLYWAVRRGLGSIVFCLVGGIKIEELPQEMAKVVQVVQQKYPTHFFRFKNICNEEEQIFGCLPHISESIEEDKQWDTMKEILQEVYC